jgi:hypothetical protein
MTSCTWVKDETDDCPYGFWLNLHYTYNILDVEAAPEYINEVSVFIYDAEGNYVSRLDVPRSVLAANDHRVRIEGLQEGDYQFVVWSGVAGSQYALSGDRSTMADFLLSLSGSGTTVTTRLSDLYYGNLPLVHYDDAYAVHDVWMMKDTNQLTCLFVPLSGDVAVSPADYDVKVVSANGTMNVLNKPVSATPITYLPFERNSVTVNDSEYGELHGIGFSLTTLRLMADLDSRLVFQKADTGETIFNISLPEYVGMIGSYYTNLGRQLTLQEYLDRQDFYHIVFFLSEDFSTLIRLDVNSWRLRAKNHLKL